ncbi:MAG: CBS domain-containing protein [Planctomycetota bacterium]|jgi:CBS domain-containing protein
MDVIKVARVPAPVVPVSMSVKEAIPRIHGEAGCAVGVVDGKRLVGTVTKDDVLNKVVAKGLDPASTRVEAIMRQLECSIGPDTDTKDALQLMLEKRQCYMPIVDGDGNAVGWLGVCTLFNEQVEMLDDQVDTLNAYLGADTPGD